jgi:hypothetical protein
MTAPTWTPFAHSPVTTDSGGTQAVTPSPTSAMVICRAFMTRAPVDGAAFTAMTSDTIRDTICASDPVIAEIEQIQYSLGQGPTQDAFTTRRPVLIPDLNAPRAATRWPTFIAETRHLTVGGLFAFPMQLGAITAGVCAVYRQQPAPLTVLDLRSVLHAVDAATLALLSLRAGEPREDGDPDTRPLDGPGSAQRVHQATGMLIAQLDVGAEEAFARLRAHAYADSKGIHEIADDIVSRRLRLEPDPT